MADVLGQEKSQLVITFKTDTNENYNFTLANPREDLGESEIQAIANCILNNQIFRPQIGSTLASIEKARIVQTETDKFDLV